MSRLTEIDLWNYYELTKPVKNRNPETANKTVFIAANQALDPFHHRIRFKDYIWDDVIKSIQTLWIPFHLRYSGYEKITGTPRVRYIFQLINKPRFRFSWFPENGTLFSTMEECIDACVSYNKATLSLTSNDDVYLAYIESLKIWKNHYL